MLALIQSEFLPHTISIKLIAVFTCPKTASAPAVQTLAVVSWQPMAVYAQSVPVLRFRTAQPLTDLKKMSLQSVFLLTADSLSSYSISVH